MENTEILISGSGPTGLVLALWLTQQGCTVRIIDKNSGPGQTSRAMAVQARTLECYRQLGMADAAVAAGYKMPAMNMWAFGKHKARIQLSDAGMQISPYPFILIFPQDRHEQFLIDGLRDLGVEVERETELTSFKENATGISAVLRHKEGEEETCQALYLAACDGARSLIRHQLGINFEGGTYGQIFYVADVEASGMEPAGEGHLAFDKSEFVLLMSYGEPDQYRLIGIVQDESTTQHETPAFSDVCQKAIDGLKIRINKVNWFSTYKVHHRVTDHFRHGRVFLLGDAAHVHSPAGGQGMNTGILDAINLAWKIAAVVKGKAEDKLLDSYEAERRAFARKLVATTDRVFTIATARGGFADFVRTRIAPVVASVAYTFRYFRKYLFQVVSQTSLHYRDSPLSVGKAGKVQGGDRLPWVQIEGVDNYATLSDITWQIHVYGQAPTDLQAWCTENQVPLHQFTWTPEYGATGLEKDAAYLLRPDTYVALADPEAFVATIARYFSDRGMKMNP